MTNYRRFLIFVLVLFAIGGSDMLAQEDGAVTTPHKVRFQGVGSIGLNGCITFPMVNPYADVALGIRIKDRAFVGGSVGVVLVIGDFAGCKCAKPWVVAATLPNISLRGDIYLTNARIVDPYMSAQIGYAIYPYMKIGLGADFKQFSLQLGYLPLFKVASSNNGVYSGLYLEVGYRFNSVKYNKQKRNERME